MFFSTSSIKFWVFIYYILLLKKYSPMIKFLIKSDKKNKNFKSTACQASCEIHDEFLIKPRAQFKVGKVDGAAFIMSFMFVFFLAFFVRYLYVKHIRPKTSGLGSNSSTSSSIDSTENPTFDQKKAKKCAPLDYLCGRERKNSLLTETDEASEPSRRSRYKKRLKSGLQKVNLLDKMLQFGDKLERWIELKFQNLGKFCATYPLLVLSLGLTFCCLMCVGYFNFKIEKDPIRLWSADSSIARQNKKYFDHHFGPFYRITQLIVEPKSSLEPSTYLNMTITGLQVKILQEAFGLYSKLVAIKDPVSLDDICFKPMAPENNQCAVQSIFQYFQNSEKKMVEHLSEEAEAYRYLLMCMRNPLTVDCLSSYGGPIQPYLVIGSYDSTKTDYINAGSLIINFIINNYDNEDKKIGAAMAWEQQALGILNNYTSDLINVYYTTERSIEDELERESKADIKIIAISYLAMFFYLTLTLGKYSSLNLKVIILEMKIFLALAGVSLVVLSVFSSGGFFASIGVPSTLITLEVIPFLLLAVGVDNVYILVQTYQNDERRPAETIEEQISRIVGKVGPSMLLTGTTQSAAFLISALTPMPGVRAFSLYASLAIIINFLMQITCFVVLLTLDAKREQAKRIDLLCCIKLNLSAMGDSLQKKKSFLYKFFNKVYTPILFNNVVRAVVIVVFVGFFFACLAMCDKIKVGLDQKLTMPQDSYQLKYFEALQKHLSVGPPVYFVLKDGYNYTSVDQVRKLCGSPACHTNSLQSLVSSASFFPDQTYIAQPPENWLDDYMEWLEATSPSYCCYEYVAERKFCDYVKLDLQDEHLCHKCPVHRAKYGFPDQTSLFNYVKPPKKLAGTAIHLLGSQTYDFCRSSLKLDFDFMTFTFDQLWKV
ncbi:Niemann-Pick C1, partial [Brachionus plicatilis]